MAARTASRGVGAATCCWLLLVSGVAGPQPITRRVWTLPELQAAARVHDPRVAQARAKVSVLRGLQAEADAAVFPTTGFVTGFGAPIPQYTNDPDAIDDVDAVSRKYNGMMGDWGFIFTVDGFAYQPLYTFGKIEHYRKAAELGVTATQDMVYAAQQQAARDASEVFWGMQLAQRGLVVLGEADGELDKVRQQVLDLLAAESLQVTRSDLDKLEMVRAELRARRAEAQAGLTLAQQAGRLLTNLPAGAPFSVAEADLDPAPIRLVPMQRYIEVALAHRPEIAAARRAVAARQALIGAHKREFFPDLVGVLLFKYSHCSSCTVQTNPFAADPYNGRAFVLGLGLRGDLNIAHHLVVLQQAMADLETELAQQQVAVGGIRLQVTKAYTSLEALMAKAAHMKEQHTAAQSWATAAKLAFDTGIGPSQDLLFAALLLARAQAELMSASQKAAVGVADLELAIGTDPHAVTEW